MIPRLSLSGVSKSFGAMQVLQRVSLTLMPGEVQGLLGENGAGRSRLLNIPCGVLSKDAGTVEIDRPPAHSTAPRAAAAIGEASLMGGRCCIIGTLIGCIIGCTLLNGLTLLNVQAFCHLLATGIIIIVAMLIDMAASGKQGGLNG